MNQVRDNLQFVCVYIGVQLMKSRCDAVLYHTTHIPLPLPWQLHKLSPSANKKRVMGRYPTTVFFHTVKVFFHKVAILYYGPQYLLVCSCHYSHISLLFFTHLTLALSLIAISSVAGYSLTPLLITKLLNHDDAAVHFGPT